LRVRVVKADDLVAKDRNGTSDPCVASTLYEFPADGSTFDYPIYLSLAGVVGARGLEGVVWDKVS
jgi:phosphatidylserine decarboxylase